MPGVWPPAEFGGRRYLDGGVWRAAAAKAGRAQGRLAAAEARKVFG